MDNKAKDILDKALDDLAGDIDSPDSKEKLAQLWASMAKFHNYSFGNQALISWQRPDATKVKGFKSWPELGRTVKKGEKGIAILAPCPYNKVGDDGKNRSGVFFRTVYVFDVSQTEGAELPSFYSQIEGDFSNVEHKLEAFCASKNIALEDRVISGGANTGTTYGLSYKGKIALKEGMESGRRLLVLVHELAHELLHGTEERKGLSTAAKEVDAEATAFVVASYLGIASPESGAYIKMHGGDSKLLKERFGAISKAAKEIIAQVA